jgi:hypothetical protein
MAYQIKYTITAATKSDVTSVVNIYEDGYAGSIIEYPCIGLQIQYIPRSDDAFEPIYVSSLSMLLDVTDDIENMPDFTTLNDRKYFVRVLSGENVDWQGWILSENVQYSFSTGRKELAFNAIDGLGMLERIPFFVSNDTTLVDIYTAIFYIKTALLSLQYPLEYDIVSGVSFYADGMDNRTDNPAADTLGQSYINYATFVNDNQQATNCLDVLTKIVKSFGSRLFQAKGNFYIVPLTQFAQDSYYATIYNSDGTVFDDVIDNTSGTIEGFTSNTSGLYFVDNSQFKLIRKGFNKVRFDKVIEYPNNYITNWDLKNYTVVSPTVGNAFSWDEQRFVDGIIYVKSYPEKRSNSFIMEYSIASPYTAIVSPLSLPKVNSSDVLKLSMDVAGLGVPASGPDALFILKILVDGGVAGSVFLDDNEQWVNTTFNDHYYYYPFDSTKPKVNLDLTMPLLPQGGDLSIDLIICDASAPYWKSTVGSIEVSNFQLAVETYFKQVTTESFITDSDEYVLEIDLPLGFNDINDGFFSYRGFLSDVDGLNLKNWYRQEYPLDIYRSLSELVIKQYSNCFNNNIINLDASFMSMQTNNGRFSGAMRITATDTDPAQISVQNKKYIIGNSTLDLPNDVITATLLDINPENIETTMTTIYDSNNLPTEVTGFSHVRSNGYITKEAALAAPFTSNLVYLEQIGVPSVGDFFYQNEFLFVGFNGANIWWRVLVTDTYSQAYRISGAGEILETYG